MKLAVFVIGLGVTSVLAGPAFADVRELERDELRANVRSGKSMSLSKLMGVIESRVQAEVVDVRAFEADGIFYRVLLKRPDGKLSVAIVDARTGAFVSGRSEVARSVMAAAKSNNGKGNKGNSGQSNAGGRGNSGSNAGGNSGNTPGGGNAGGGNSGGGNSGGNSGGGNSGGGNSGGGNGKN